jgi:hypothetical protein
MTILHVTLSRAHKLAERLKNGSTELFAQSLELAMPKQLHSHEVARSQLDSLQAQGQQALALFAEGERWSLALVSVRDTIGKENVTRSINSKLARMDGFNRILAQKKILLQVFNAVALGPADIRAMTPSLNPNSYSTSLTCRVLDVAGKEQLVAEIEALQTSIFQLTDEIAEANAGRADFVLPDDIAAKISGS